MRSPLVAVALAVLAGACSTRERPPVFSDFDAGAEPDVGFFRTPDAVPLRHPDVSCGGTAVSLTRRRATAALLIDRSGSMHNPGGDGTPKWTALLGALRDVLPRVQSELAVGLALFPVVPAVEGHMTTAEICQVSSALVVEPALGTAAAILAELDAHAPTGSTPTDAALEQAQRWFASAPDLDGERYVILATDGAPNCDAALLPAGCRCTLMAAQCQGGPTFSPEACLDADRTLATIAALRAAGITTYVIGLAGVEDFTDVLDAMAVAGGHPRAGAPRYFSAGTAAELAGEFATVTSSLVECRFALDGAPPDPSLVDVRLDGASLVHDVGQRDGWDWSDDAHREIHFDGSTCDLVRAATGGSRLVASFGCPAPVPP